MRVTHVITRLIVGGAQENTIASVIGLREKYRLDVDLISGPSAGPEGSLVSGLEFRVSGFRDAANSKPENRNLECAPQNPKLTVIPSLVRPVHPLKDLIALRRLESVFRESRPDIVHTHSGKAGILGRLAAARAGVPAIVHTIHGPSFGPFQGAIANFIFRTAERRAAKVTTHFVAVANAMTEQYLAAGIGRPGQYTRILSGFHLEPFLTARNDPELRAHFGMAPDDFVIGKIARLFKLKGHDDLFAVAPELVRRNPKIRFLLVGDGAWRSRFENTARTLGLEKHFRFTGLVPPADVPNYVGIMDALAHLSLREGLPRALPQALAAARPVVAYDCDGAKEVCIENETGFLLRPHDLRGLTERLLLLSEDAALRERLGKRGQAMVREQFGHERMIDDLRALYLKLARAKLVST